MKPSHNAQMDVINKALDFNQNYEKKVREAADYVKKFLGDKKPVFGIILGSGLGEVAAIIKGEKSILYKDIPNFHLTMVPGHEGRLIIGSIEGVPAICFKGRKHYYEVADEPFNNGALKAVFHIHLLAELGVKNYMATNAAGGLNLKYSVGDIMILKSHINMIPNPLLGRVLEFKRLDNNKPVERFQSMDNAYDVEFRKLLIQAGADYKKNVHEGILLGLTGPSYETEGESVAFRDHLGADAVGSSITPETIVVRNRGMRVVALSFITNTIPQDSTNSVTHEQVQACISSKEIKNRISTILREFFALYKKKFL